MDRFASRAAQGLTRRASLELEHRGPAELSRTASELLQTEVRVNSLNKETLGVGVLGGMALTVIETLGLRTAKAGATTTPANSSYRFETNSTQGRDDIPIQGAHRDRSRESQELQHESAQGNPAGPGHDSLDHLLDDISGHTLSLASDRSATSTYHGLERQDPKGSPKRFSEDRSADLPDNPFDHTLDNVSDSISCRSLNLRLDSTAEEALKANLELTSHTKSSPTAPAAPIAHAGKFNYIEAENKGRPKWLWDSQTEPTVETMPDRLREGYVAWSYRWGRFRDGRRLHHESGTLWGIPTMKECGFMMRQFKDAMRDMPNAVYHWVDVLCINQQKGEERSLEIAKQGSTFKHTKSTMVYLWTVETAEDLARAMRELGEVILMAVGDPERLSAHKQYADEYGSKLSADHCFSSLWTLQETILAPVSTWITRDGSFCQLNGQALTTHLVAGAMRVLGQLRNFSPFSAGPDGNTINDAAQK